MRKILLFFYLDFSKHGDSPLVLIRSDGLAKYVTQERARQLYQGDRFLKQIMQKEATEKDPRVVLGIGGIGWHKSI